MDCCIGLNCDVGFYNINALIKKILCSIVYFHNCGHFKIVMSNFIKTSRIKNLPEDNKLRDCYYKSNGALFIQTYNNCLG